MTTEKEDPLQGTLDLPIRRTLAIEPHRRQIMTRATIVLILVSWMGVAAFASQVQQQRISHAASQPPRNVAILIFEGVQIIDYTGPWETFGHAYSANQPVVFNIYTVAEKPSSITTAMGMSVNPKYTVANSPQPDILVVPGGNVLSAMNSPAVMQWIQDSAHGATMVMSVCNGAFILSKAGLLDGLEATTTANLIERLRAAAPKTRVVSDRRFVDNGRIITTAGLSSGIDGSLHIIERLYGRGTAEMAALAMEYNWDPESRFVRAALADKYLPNQYDIDTVTKSWVPVHRSGGVDRWESKWSMTTDRTPAEVLEHLEASFPNRNYFPRARNLQWVRRSGEHTPHHASSLWLFTDEEGNPWAGMVSIDPVVGEQQAYMVSVKVNRIVKDADRERSRPRLGIPSTPSTWVTPAPLPPRSPGVKPLPPSPRTSS